jgi:hypothetical protein
MADRPSTDGGGGHDSGDGGFDDWEAIFHRAVDYAADELWARGADEETLAALHDLLEATSEEREPEAVP